MGLRRATGVEVVRSGFGIFARHEVRSGKRVLSRVDRREYEQATATVQGGGAACLFEGDGRTLWWTADGLYWDDEALDPEAVSLLAWDRRRRQDARVDRLRKIRAAEEVIEGARRKRIPDDVRLFVWSRDDGRCVRCASEDDLQFDHVIPFARGGGNAPENVQIMCGPCNRSKSDHLA
ncbi:MAG: HNH endonuclease signature motif containing protein [Dehalococcoidia bacterium]